MNKIFTIIICAYNAKNRIYRTIESVLVQEKYNELVDQIFLVNNNSNDGTKEIMEKYSSKRKNLQYIFEKRQGLSYARLTGVLHTCSKWIVFVDDDNILRKDWLIRASEYIEREKKVGVFNGAIVPYIKESLSIEKKLLLECIYQRLACTHLNEKEIDVSQKKHPLKEPIGAGMVVRTDLLKDLAQRGWTKLSDRKGEKLSSGGDTEIARYIKSSGYEYGYNPRMLIYHLISSNRLKEEYILRLIKESAEDNFQLLQEEFSKKKIIEYSF